MTDRIKLEVPSISYIVIMTSQISAPSAAAAAGYLYHCYQHNSFSLNEAAMSATVMLYLT